MTPALDVVNLAVSFGGVVGLDAVSMTVDEGDLVGLIGPNGAGKTTLIDAVTGFVPYTGSVSLVGTCIDRTRPDERARRGLSRTFQSLELFDDLTVRENVCIGASGQMADADAALDAVGIAPTAHLLPAKLPPSTRRFVALARALAARPRMLLLDEVAAGLDRNERSALERILRSVAATGTGVLLVDHDVGFVADTAGRVIVLNAGHVIANGPPSVIRRDDEVLAAYLGRRP